MIRGQLLLRDLYRDSLLSSTALRGRTKEHHLLVGKASRLNLQMKDTAAIPWMSHTSQRTTSSHDTAHQQYQFEEYNIRFHQPAQR